MNTLIAKGFFSDPEIAKAKNQLVDCLKEHQKKIIGIKPAVSDLEVHYEELIQAFSQIRGANLWYPYLGSGIGKGSLVELLDGSVKLDMISGIGVHQFGHSHPELAAICVEAALSDIIMQGNLQQNQEGLELSQLLINHSGMPHCFLSSSGVMANENALKVAFQKNAPANRILAFDRCFAGRTLTFSQVTDKPSFREGLPLNIPVDYVPYYDSSRPEESTREALEALKKHLHRYPKMHALMIFELVQGEGGFYSGTTAFFKPLMELLKDHRVAIFADEIQSFARTSKLFAYQHFGLEELIDITALGKLSLACATLFTEEYKPKGGLLSQTFTSSTAALRASKWVIQKLIDGQFFGPIGRNMEIQKRFHGHLQDIQDRHANKIKGPFGVGAMVAFTLGDGALDKTTQMAHDLFDEGLITFIAGNKPTRIRMLPPAGVLTNEEIDQAVHIIEQTALKF